MIRAFSAIAEKQPFNRILYQPLARKASAYFAAAEPDRLLVQQPPVIGANRQFAPAEAGEW